MTIPSDSSHSVPALRLSGVTMAYGARDVVHSITLDVAQGETFGLIGLNGAGKTTLIKGILGLRDHRTGDILINGHDRLVGEAKKSLAYLPEKFEPPWFLRGAEFIKFSMRLYGKVFNLDEARALADHLGLNPDVLGHRVQTYSKGMRQKLGLMATLMTGAELSILDEPMSGLDPRARAAVKDALLQTKAQGRAIFLSSHILADMDEICDRVAVLHDGVLVYIGPPAGLRDRAGVDNLERAFLKVIDTPSAAA
ncbi:ABC transporter ATP-binding protein [Micavibrio aeruginosavorus]|uniref:ABC transporter ATP-binding protein n=1 Tax=Micavibrio aeruginosavorus EPB TaxID=349215 RepID=M4VJP4_9BACT|nr:ABC transporter ATP-binding protein [Micavibrio aeruginosavorus]AGH98281.1 ABC transporter ATP-binding protein [Micavibrio aeruginosavorus EPB]